MRAYCTLTIAAALGASGCVLHLHGNRNAPGYSDVRHGHVTPPGVFKPPGDPGEHALIVQATEIGAVGADIAKSGKGYYTAGVEFSFVLDTLEQSHSGTKVVEALKHQPVRPYLGWMFVRVDDGDKPRPGPAYFELRYSSDPGELLSVSAGGGLALDVTGHGAGPQLTGCVSLIFELAGLCVRATEVFNRGTDVQLQIVGSGFLEYLWSR